MRWCTVDDVGRITSIGLCPDRDEITIPGISDRIIAPVPDEVMPETHYFSRAGEFLQFGEPPTEWHEWDWTTMAWAENFAGAQSARSSSIDAACKTAILDGFESAALGAAHHYPAKSTDQQNLASSVLASLLPGLPYGWTTPFWCVDSMGIWEMRPHTAAEIQQVGQDAKTAILAAMAKNDALQQQIAAATTIDQLEAITWHE